MAFWTTPPTCTSAGEPPVSNVSSAVAASFSSHPFLMSQKTFVVRIPSWYVSASHWSEPCWLTSIPPSPIPVLRTPGISRVRASKVRPCGSTSIIWRVTTAWRRTCCTSTTGDSPVTVTVSSTAPTCSWALICTALSPISSTSSRITVLNPGKVNVTV